MTPAHQFSQLPTAYYRELLATNRQKAIAFLEYAVDDSSGDMESDRHYGRVWGKSSSTSKAWIEDFRDAIKEYYQAKSDFTTKNAEKTKQKKTKKSRTPTEQIPNTNRTDKSSESSVNSEFQEYQSNTYQTDIEHQSNTPTIEENVDIYSIGGDIREYLEFRLSDDDIYNHKGLKITILRDLADPESQEFKDFLEYKRIQLESSYQLQRLIEDFANFGHGSRKSCKDICQMLEKELGLSIQFTLFNIAFFEAKKLISKRSKRSA